MRGATQAAKRLKKLFSKLRSQHGKASPLPLSDPISQLILGVFSRNMPESKAREVLDRMRAMVVDYNELRVIPPLELAEELGELPQVRRKCEDVSRALNMIFAREHVVSLDHLKQASKKDAKVYLDQVDGIDAYTRARIRLLGLEQHGIPLDEAMWAYARSNEIVDDRCELDEAQGFLERQVSQADALEFVSLLKKEAWSEFSAAVRKGDTPRIESADPDRTTSHMLQEVAGGGVTSMVQASPAVQTEVVHEPIQRVEIEPADPVDASATTRRKRSKSTGAAKRTSNPPTTAAKSAGRPRTTKKTTTKKASSTARKKSTAKKTARKTSRKTRSRSA